MDVQQENKTPKAHGQNGRPNGMALASVILGSVALASFSCIYLSAVCGSLGIVLALLSKGPSYHMDARGTAGLALSASGLALTVLTYALALLFLIRSFGGVDGFLREYESLYKASSVEELYQILDSAK